MLQRGLRVGGVGGEVQSLSPALRRKNEAGLKRGNLSKVRGRGGECAPLEVPTKGFWALGASTATSQASAGRGRSVLMAI